jgi:hypothetical protein
LNLLRHLLGWKVYGFCLKCVWVGCNVFIWAKRSAQFEVQFKFGLVTNCSCLCHHLPRQCHASTITVPHVCHVSATQCHVSATLVPRSAMWLTPHMPCGCHVINWHVINRHISATSAANSSP